MAEQKKYEISFKKGITILLSVFILGGLLFYMILILMPNNSLRLIEEKFLVNNELNQSREEFIKIKAIDEQELVVAAVTKASPAVVSIVASAEVPVFETYFENPFFGAPGMLDNFFNFGIPMRRQSGTEYVRVGAGTGFIVSADGYIITNKHVVADERAEYVVYLNDGSNQGEKVEAKVLARDPDHDLAVLKIEKDNLPFLEFSNSDDLQVGQTAITIGYALGEFDNTVSKGVVSGLSRSITAGGRGAVERLTNLIQTDAAINPGNSGGPMLNLDGQVIGVNVAMASAENIGFAILGNYAQRAFEQVKETGEITRQARAFLGIRYMIVDERLQSANRLPYNYGALVIRGENREDLAVTPGSPADKAGIVENDIILEINNERINARQSLADLILKYQPGDKVRLKVFHKGEEKEVEVELGNF